MTASQEGLHLLFQADLEQQLGRLGDQLAQRVASEPGLETLSECLLHLDARWVSSSRRSAPFSVRSGRLGVDPGRIPYTLQF